MGSIRFYNIYICVYLSALFLFTFYIAYSWRGIEIPLDYGMFLMLLYVMLWGFSIVATLLYLIGTKQLENIR